MEEEHWSERKPWEMGVEGEKVPTKTEASIILPSSRKLPDIVLAA